jgi:hypothetical protein
MQELTQGAQSLVHHKHWLWGSFNYPLLERPDLKRVFWLEKEHEKKECAKSQQPNHQLRAWWSHQPRNL